MIREGDYTLITGGAGFIGSNLADALLREGERVVILDSLVRPGVSRNIEWLHSNHGNRLRVEEGDVTDRARVAPLVQGATAIFHLAAQVAVTTSLQDPRADLESNLLGTFNVLEAARSLASPPPILFTSTNKVYGALDGIRVERALDGYRYADGRDGISEAMPLNFHSPYGCSKGAADQYVRDYARIYGLRTSVLRMSCIYGDRQFGTEDQGWVAHFGRALLNDEPITIYGDGLQVRDLLWIDDLIEAMRRALEMAKARPGEVFNIGGGAANAVSVRRVVERLADLTGYQQMPRMAEWRPGDQRIYISDNSKAEAELGWTPTTRWDEGLGRLIDWLQSAGLTGTRTPLQHHEPARLAL